MFTRLALAALCSGVIFTGAASASHYEHLARHAHELEASAATLARELHLHYRHSPEYRHARADLLRVEQLVQRVHHLAHAQAPVDQLRCDVEQLDGAYGHLKEAIFLMDRPAADCPHGHGQSFTARFRDPRGVREALRRFDASLFALRSDVSQLWLASQRTHHHRSQMGRDDFRGGRPGRHAVAGPAPRQGLTWHTPSFSIRLGR